MKFYCDSCGAKYLIGDEKVRGKVLRIRCKKCDHVITVREPTAPADSGSIEQIQRKLQERGAAAAPQGAWHYSVSGQSFGPLSLEELRAKFSDKELGDETYLWHETFDGWKPARECAVVSDLFQQGSVRKPRNPTISLSTNEIRALAERRSQELQAQQGAAPKAATAAVSTAAASTGTSILQRASRSRALERPSPAARPAPAASVAPERASAEPPSGDEGGASPQDRIRALRERLRANAPAQPSAGSLRDRLRTVGKPLEEAAPAPQREPLRPAASLARPSLRPQGGSALARAPREEPEVVPTVIAPVEPEVIPTVVVPVEPEVVPTVIAPVKAAAPAFEEEETFEAPREALEPPEDEVSLVEAPPSVLEEAEPDGIASALERAAQRAAAPAFEEAPEAVASSDEEAAFFDAPAPTPMFEAAPEPLSFVDPSLASTAPEDDFLRPSHTSTGLFTALPPASPEIGGLRPISPEAQASATREDSVSSASLLIQLDSLKKAQRARQMMFGGAALALLLLVGVTGFILFTYASDSRNKELAQEAEASRLRAERERASQRSGVEQRRTYDPNTLRAMGGAAPPAEEAPPEENPQPSAKTEKVAVKPPSNPLLGGDPNKLDKALAGAGAAPPTDSGLKAGDPGEAGALSKINRLEHNPMDTTPTDVLAGASRTRIEGREKLPDEGAPAANLLPKSLDKASLDKGFEGVRRSVDQCLARHRKVHGEPPKGKVKLGVTITRTGQVSALSIDDDVANSVFHSCMLSHRTRWAFPAFDGEPIQVRKSFVLQ